MNYKNRLSLLALLPLLTSCGSSSILCKNLADIPEGNYDGVLKKDRDTCAGAEAGTPTISVNHSVSASCSSTSKAEIVIYDEQDRRYEEKTYNILSQSFTANADTETLPSTRIFNSSIKYENFSGKNALATVTYSYSDVSLADCEVRYTGRLFKR